MNDGHDWTDPLDTFFRGLFQGLAAPLFPDGASFHGFVNLRKRGKGGQGEVYAAWDPRHGRFVALKFPLGERGSLPASPDGTPADSTTEDQRAAPLLAEARRAAALGLPHVITVHGFRDDAGLPFLEMEYAAGGKLSDWKDACRANPRLLADWLIPVVRDLDLAHRTGLVHRDLKPDNLLLVYPVPAAAPADGSAPPLPERQTLPADRLTCKMADFGLAGPSGDGRASGTPGYAPPEQWAGKVDPAADVFAVGATIHFLLTGVAPGPPPAREYRPPDGSALAAAGADRDLQQIVLRALRADPGARYSSAAALADDLGRWRRGDPISSTGAARRVVLWARKQPAGIRAVLIAVAVLVPIALGLGAVAAVATERAGRAALAEADARQKVLDAREVADRERQASHNQRLAAARGLAAVGRWEQALVEFAALGEDPLTTPAEALSLRVETLPGLLAVHRLADFGHELDALAGRPDLGALAAPVRLYEAERLLWRPSTQVQGQETLRTALDLFHNAPPGDRSAGWDGDAAYAEALAADTPKAMVDLLREALARTPYHYPARRTLIVALAAQGRFRHKQTLGGSAGDFEEQAAVAERYFPGSPVAGFAVELVRVLRSGREPEVARLRMGAGWGEKDRGRLARLFSEVVACQRTIATIRPVRDSTPGNLAVPAADAIAVFQEAGKVKWIMAGGSTLYGLGDSLFPRLGIPYPAFAPLPETFLAFDHYTAVWTGGPEELRAAVRSLEAVHARHPEALLLYFVAALRVQLGHQLLGAGKDSEALAELAQVPDAVAQANRAPTLAPPSRYTYRTQMAAAVAAGLTLRLRPNAEAVTRDQLQDAVDHLIKLGRMFPDIRPEVVRLTLSVLGGGPLPPERQAWQLNTPQGREGYRARKELLLDSLARPLLNDWALEDRPAGKGNTEPRALREQVEKWSKE